MDDRHTLSVKQQHRVLVAEIDLLGGLGEAVQGQVVGDQRGDLTLPVLDRCDVAGERTVRSDDRDERKTGWAQGPSVEDDGTVVMGEVA